MKTKKGGFLTIVITVLILIVLAYPVYAKTTPEGYTVLGKGNTCAYYIDNDADGYGVGPAPLGTDADDNDATINTPVTVLGDYDANINGKLDNDELKLFLKEHNGYNVNNVYYFSPEGNDTTAEVNNPDKPFGIAGYGVRKAIDDWYDFFMHVQPGDAVIFREGYYKKEIPGNPYYYINLGIFKSGTEANPIILMTYPGENAVLDAPENIGMGGSSNIIIDGLELASTIYPEQGRAIDGSRVNNIILRNLNIHGHKWGLGPSGDSHNELYENNVIHDNLGEHGIYIGANESSGPNSNITIRGNVIYGNSRTGIQHNGQVTNLIIENNIIHSNIMAGISLLMGVSHSFIRNNLVFNNMKQGIVFFIYDEGNDFILPYDQMYNVIEGNTIWVGKYNWNGSGTNVDSHGAIVFSNAGNPAQGIRFMDYNTIRNNILVTSNGPIFWFHQRDYADTTTIENNVIYRIGGDAKVMQYGDDYVTYGYDGIYYNMNEFEAFSPLFQNNLFAEPQFTHVSIDDYATPGKFNFDLISSSPAISFANPLTATPTDLRGSLRDSNPDAGCYEYASGAPPVVIYGDVSGNGEISAADASLAAQYAVGLITLTPEQITKADVSGNGEVTAADASLIAQRAVGLIDKFPVEG